ncbi:hypothetical protein BDV36DRAFT_261492 [Aspergillus pseudocaelatus]|uniref:Uncharacterized protein n=1 Tax=Aspergillus pseudocaelatus TaxID=1825620 RepID=A0ABQ6WFS0_9EURO|nr:hypothetical protein BDV36DRAFT_261492 [Aspergillus pseudocaelatus]
MQLARTPVYYLTAVGDCTPSGVVLYVLLTSEVHTHFPFSLAGDVRSSGVAVCTTRTRVSTITDIHTCICHTSVRKEKWPENIPITCRFPGNGTEVNPQCISGIWATAM